MKISFFRPSENMGQDSQNTQKLMSTVLNSEDIVFSSSRSCQKDSNIFCTNHKLL